MKDTMYYIIPLIISGVILAPMALRYKWSNRLWTFLDRKWTMGRSLKVGLFILLDVLVQLLFRQAFIMIGVNELYTQIPMGIVAGIFVCLIPSPSLGKTMYKAEE